MDNNTRHSSARSLIFRITLFPNPSYMGGWSAGCSKVHPGSLDYRGEEVETVPPRGGDGVVRETRIDVSGHQRTHTDVSVEINHKLMLQPDWGMARLES